MSLLLSLLLAVAPANAACGNSPCGTAVTAPAPQASAEGATHLAAAAYSKALRAIKAGAKNSAELRKVAERMEYFSTHQAAAERNIAEIKATLSDLQAQIDRLEHRVSNVEHHQVALIVGAGASAWFGPAISQVYYGDAIPYVIGEAGFASETKRSGWSLMGVGEYNPGLQSPGFGGYAALYAKNPFGIRRTAVGGYAGGDFRSFGQQADYDGYKAVADAGVYLRVTADKPRDGFGAFVTVRAGAYYGMAADYTGASAPEFGGTVTATLQGGKFWRF